MCGQNSVTVATALYPGYVGLTVQPQMAYDDFGLQLEKRPLVAV